MLDAVVDLSHWQYGPAGRTSPVDFVAMQESGVQAVMLKATQGISFVDATFVSRVAAATAAGLLVGAYHFADASDPTMQASHFLKMAGSLSRLAIDIEPNGIGNTVSVAQAAALVSAIHQQSQCLPAVYIGRWGPTGNGAGLPNIVLARCDLWLPAYVKNPVPPSGWDDWTLWQYTQSATVPGVGGPCDRSQFKGSAEELVSWWNP